MKVNWNEQNVKDLAGRLRRAVGSQRLSHAKCLELVASSLGYPHWDAFAAALKRDPGVPASSSRFVLDATVDLYTGVYSENEWTDDPQWAKVPLTQTLLDKLQDLRQLCVEQALNTVTVDFMHVTWQNEQEYRVRYDRLNVDANTWWFSASRGDYDIRTHVIYFDNFFEALAKKQSVTEFCWRQDTWFFEQSGDAYSLIDSLVEDGILSDSYLQA